MTYDENNALDDEEMAAMLTFFRLYKIAKELERECLEAGSAVAE